MHFSPNGRSRPLKRRPNMISNGGAPRPPVENRLYKKEACLPSHAYIWWWPDTFALILSSR